MSAADIHDLPCSFMASTLYRSAQLQGVQHAGPKILGSAVLDHSCPIELPLCSAFNLLVGCCLFLLVQLTISASNAPSAPCLQEGWVTWQAPRLRLRLEKKRSSPRVLLLPPANCSAAFPRQPTQLTASHEQGLGLKKGIFESASPTLHSLIVRPDM